MKYVNFFLFIYILILMNLTWELDFYKSNEIEVKQAIVQMPVKRNKNSSVKRTVNINWTKLASKLIKKHEGFRPFTYLCPTGHKTIGYGFTDKKSLSYVIMTKGQADEILIKKVKSIGQFLDRCNLRLTAIQKAVLIDFIYNVGRGNFLRSTLYKYLKSGQYDHIPSELQRWVYGHKGHKKIKLKGLIKRRKLCAHLWAFSIRNFNG